MKFSGSFKEYEYNILINYTEKLNKKLHKKGFSEISVITTESFDGIDDCSGMFTKIYNVEIYQDDVIINGWQFLAKRDHTFKTDIIITTLANIEIDFMWYERDSFCDHCKTKRRRNTSYVIMNIETGEIKFIGSTCIKEFCVFSNNYYLDFSSWFTKFTRSLTSIANDEEKDGYGFSSKIYYDVSKILEISSAIIRKDGAYLKVSEHNSTCYRFFKALNSKDKDDKIFPDEKDLEYAREAKEYFLNCDITASSFNRTIHTLINEDKIDRKYVSFICAAMGNYLNKNGILNKISEFQFSNNFFGDISIRYKNQKLKIKQCKYIGTDDFRNDRYIFIFTNENNDRLVWFTNNPKENIKECESDHIFTFTVKDHSTFNNQKQTIITRVKEC